MQLMRGDERCMSFRGNDEREPMGDSLLSCSDTFSHAALDNTGLQLK